MCAWGGWRLQLLAGVGPEGAEVAREVLRSPSCETSGLYPGPRLGWGGGVSMENPGPARKRGGRRGTRQGRQGDGPQRQEGKHV